MRSDDTMKVLVIPVDTDPIEEQFDKEIEYTWIKEAIGGGWLEAVYPTDAVTLWCDEEGKLKSLPPNPTATWLWWFLQPEARGRDVLHGTVVVTGGIDGEGSSMSVPTLLVDLMINVVGVQDDPNTAAEYE